MAHFEIPMRELALFAGAGGGILGGHLLNWRTLCAVERDAYAASILVARQNDGLLPVFPIWSDVSSFDGKPWKGRIDVISGGFPCQDISSAGKGIGIDGARSGLWSQFARIIGEVRPQFAFIENSPMLASRGLEKVLSDLATMGYDAKWCCLGADDFGAPHQRKRLWILGADINQIRRPVFNPMDEIGIGQCKIWEHEKFAQCLDACPIWEGAKYGANELSDGLSTLVDEVSALGNAQIPFVAAAAYSILRKQFEAS